jgi:NADPH-dependent glutamate synthase beta subunit-like oxidoreductase
VEYGVRVGGDVTLEQLRQDFDAVYVGVGAQSGIRLGVEGEDLPGIYSGVEFLRRANSGQLTDAGGEVLVIGGGNAAIDAARVAARLGGRATIVYRRGRQEMPAIPEEIWEAEQEGVNLDYLAAPVKISAAAAGSAEPLEVTFIRMELGEPDRSGRRRPVPVEGSEFMMPADTVIAAIGQEPAMSGLTEMAGGDGWGEATGPAGQSNLPGVFIGGDMTAVNFATKAVGAGRQAARAMVAFLHGHTYREPYIPAPVLAHEMRLEYYNHAPRHDHQYLPPGERVKNFDEVNLPLSAEEAIAETGRCMSCGLCLVCDRCRIFCCEEAISKDISRPQGRVMFTDYAKCVGCGTCADVCPCHYIEMGY